MKHEQQGMWSRLTFSLEAALKLTPLSTRGRPGRYRIATCLNSTSPRAGQPEGGCKDNGHISHLLICNSQRSEDWRVEMEMKLKSRASGATTHLGLHNSLGASILGGSLFGEFAVLTNPLHRVELSSTNNEEDKGLWVQEKHLRWSSPGKHDKEPRETIKRSPEIRAPSPHIVLKDGALPHCD